MHDHQAQPMKGPVNDEKNEDGGEEDSMFSSLFVCEEYVEKYFSFWGVEQRLLCSNMSTTDHDLTGQIVWPASKSLSWFIAKNGNELFSGKNVIELGAGCGLAGFVCAQFCKYIAITDGNEVVLRLIKRNIEEKIAVSNCPSRNVLASKLIWGQKQAVEDFLAENKCPPPDIIIGADVILWPAYTRALLLTVRWLLSLKPGSKCFISYINRAQSTTDLLYGHAKDLNLTINTIPLDSFLPCETEIETHSESSPSGINEAYFKRLPEMCMLDISLDMGLLTKTLSLGNNSQYCEDGTELSSLFKALPCEDAGWTAVSCSNNSPF